VACRRCTPKALEQIVQRAELEGGDRVLGMRRRVPSAGVGLRMAGIDGADFAARMQAFARSALRIPAMQALACS
jgi:hypothetical protein